MDPEVLGQFGVERRADDGTVPDGDGAAVPLREHLRLADTLDDRRADEHRREGVVQSLDAEGRLETVLLAAEGVALDGDVDETEFVDAVVVGIGRGDDEPRTRRQDGPARLDVGDDFLGDPLAVEVPGDGRRLTAGQQEEVAVRDAPGRPDLGDRHVLAVAVCGPPDRRRMFADVPLDGDHARSDAHTRTGEFHGEKPLVGRNRCGDRPPAAATGIAARATRGPNC